MRNLPADANRELDRETRELAEKLADFARAAGRADTRQSARAATTVRAETGRGFPQAVVGPHPLLFGSEFGIKRRTGWYAKPRYLDSPARQFRPWNNSSYWFLRTQTERGPEIQEAFTEIADAIIEAWGP
jgi:hypothetical protein